MLGWVSGWAGVGVLGDRVGLCVVVFSRSLVFL